MRVRVRVRGRVRVRVRVSPRLHMEEGSLSAAVVEHSQRAAESLCVELAWLELGLELGTGLGFRVRVRAG